MDRCSDCQQRSILRFRSEPRDQTMDSWIGYRKKEQPVGVQPARSRTPSRGIEVKDVLICLALREAARQYSVCRSKSTKTIAKAAKALRDVCSGKKFGFLQAGNRMGLMNSPIIVLCATKTAFTLLNLNRIWGLVLEMPER